MKRYTTLLVLLCAAICMKAAGGLTLSDLTGGMYSARGISGVTPLLDGESYGCIAPGVLRDGIRGRIFDSTKAFYDLMDFYLVPAHERGQQIWLNIER